MKEKYVICILGATASGKTALAIETAKHFNTEIISTDSRQFYREMTIGTAKPNAEELSQIKHHFINSLSVTEEYSAGKFETDALQKIEELHQTKDVVVLAGGSGLYINAILFGIDPFPKIPTAVRNKVIGLYKEKGIDALRNELRHLDPETYVFIDLDNPRRLMRALEVCYASGTTYASFRKQKPKKRPFKVINLAYDYPREELYERINKRVDIMLQNGLEEEAKKLLPYRNTYALNTIGYKELFPYFENEITKNEAIELIKRNSRRYAKRQLTWFRKDESIHWLKPKINLTKLFTEIEKIIHKK